MRDNRWLKARLNQIINQYFPDINICNNLTIQFGRKARTRLGSIRKQYYGSFLNQMLRKYDSQILMNGLFRDEEIPEVIVDTTIAHELCHYAHGFSSPLPQLSRYPHSGGIVDSELIKRGLGDDLIAQKKWLKKHWIRIIRENKL